MRPLTVTTFLSLDGVMQGPGGPEEDTSNGFTLGGWTVPYFTEELGAGMVETFAKAADFLIGRGTYDIFAGFWPDAPTENDPIAAGLNALPKHVASRSIDTAQWDGAHVIEGDVVEAVRELKNADGGELQVHGSPGLIQTLLANDLVDELKVMVFPVVVGEGKRLFGEGAIPTAWKLVESSTTDAGVVVLRYQRDGELKTGTFEHEG